MVLAEKTHYEILIMPKSIQKFNAKQPNLGFLLELKLILKHIWKRKGLKCHILNLITKLGQLEQRALSRETGKQTTHISCS